jgi:hypothetical protein
MYALVTDDLVQQVLVELPASARRLDTREWVMGLARADVSLQEACGYFVVTETAQPAPVAGFMWESSVVLNAGRPVVQWTQRALSANEVQKGTRGANRATLADLATVLAKMAELKTFLVDPDVDTALNIANSTALTTQQLNRALKAIIRQQRRDANFAIRLARYTLGQLHPELLDDISDV